MTFQSGLNVIPKQEGMGRRTSMRINDYFGGDVLGVTQNGNTNVTYSIFTVFHNC